MQLAHPLYALTSHERAPAAVRGRSVHAPEIERVWLVERRVAVDLLPRLRQTLFLHSVAPERHSNYMYTISMAPAIVHQLSQMDTCEYSDTGKR